MQIHVIQAGESLYGIAQFYGVAIDEIARANQIDPEQTLVIGQTLVIPVSGTYYYVIPGDSLYRISGRYGITPAQLAERNEISQEAALQVGQRLYIPPMPKAKIETNAYAEARQGVFPDSAVAASTENAPLLTYIAPFSYEVRADGSLSMLDVSGLQRAVSGSGAAYMMAVTNLENGSFSDTLGQTIMNNEQVQERMLSNIIRIAQAGGFSDVHFDFEFLRPQDREAYNSFLRKAAKRLHVAGLLMSTALAPKTSADQEGQWYSAHDYKVHGEVADFVVIMTYEWGYSAGPPMPVSPIEPVRQVLEYAKSEIPAEKIMMGQNLYGYDWTLPFVPGGQYAQALSPQAAITLARDNFAIIEYDYTEQTPFFHYWRGGAEHIVWFEDARSIRAKFDLLKALGLRGISYWKLGFDFPQNWLLLGDRFDIDKR